MPEKEKEKLKIIWLDGYPCMELPPNSIMKKRQKKPVEPRFTFGQLQETRTRQIMPDIRKELEKFFSTPFLPANWKIYEFDELGQIKELKDEDKENDNAK